MKWENRQLKDSKYGSKGEPYKCMEIRVERERERERG